MNDSFYTPKRIAKYMVRQVSIEDPAIIVDFAAGNGALLKAACVAWPDSEAIALDIDDATVRRLRYRNPDWSVGKCNFLLDRSRERSALLRDLSGKASLILLNPPFSCRGGSKTKIRINHRSITCSKAMAFVLLASEFLDPQGQIVAILPSSSFNSIKDSEAWKYLNDQFTCRHGTTAERGEFIGCFASCSVVVLTRRKRKRIVESNGKLPPVRVRVSLIRGTAQLHSEHGRDRTLVHTTDLQQFSVSLNGRLAGKNRPSIVGPAVLIPRVGQPRIEKVAVFAMRKRVALSDCVIGLQCESPEDAVWIKEQLVKREVSFLNLYSGTCAKYTTIARIIEFLRSIGCAAQKE